MTPQDPNRPQHGSEAEGSDAGQDDVRRLLAAARQPAQIPPDVARRLDDVLADLVTERVESPARSAPPAVRPRDQDRRRRRTAQALVAAAAASVVTIGAVNVLNSSGSGGASDSAASGGVMEQDRPTESRRRSGASGSDNTDQRQAPGPVAKKDTDATPLTKAGLPQLRIGALTADAQRLADRIESAGAPSLDKEPAGGCTRPARVAGDDVVDVRFGDRRATLVLRAAVTGQRRAEVYACDPGRDPVASTTVQSKSGRR